VLGDGGSRQQATVKALLDAGADPSLSDRDGRTPRELARMRGYDVIEALLEAAGAP
jgi:ankyrin repeat protein